MTAYRRLRIPGGTYFFTLRLAQRGATRLVDHIEGLRAAYAATCRERPFRTDAMVVLPDHLHAIWTLPPGDADFSTRWRLIKARFTRALQHGAPHCASQAKKKESGLWQRRFWEHAIRDGADMARHRHYCWVDPVRHDLVASAEDWPYSSIHRDMRNGPVLLVPDAVDVAGTFGE
ncbi:MAG: REP-associated tyrosine transposase [Marinibacterium sp.]